MSTLSEPGQTRMRDTIEAEIDALGAIDPATVDAFRVMEAAEDALQRQLTNREITPDEYDEQWTSLVLTTPPAVLKAAMTRQETVKEALGDDHGPADA